MGLSGLAMLAFLPPEVQTQVRESQRASPVTHRKLSRAAYAERIETVRRNGYAFSEGEKLPNLFGIAVPVLTAGGKVAGSIAVTIPKVRFVRANVKAYAALLKREAERLSGQRD